MMQSSNRVFVTLHLLVYLIQSNVLWGQNSSQIIWKDKSHRIYQDEAQFNLFDQDILSVVKYPRFLKLQDYISSEAIQFQKEYDFYFDYALIKVQSLRDLSALANQVHTFGGQCGLIETFTSNNLLLDITSIHSPIYSSEADLSQVQELLTQINQDNVIEDINTLVALGTRHESTGDTASNTVQDIFETRANGSNSIAINQYQHTLTNQPSVIASITGTEFPNEKVIIGAHLDSINSSGDSSAPGADDDASGVAILAELIRIIASQNLSFKRTIELQAYGAEEVGLVGSGEIAQAYVSAGQSVVAAMQIDMTMYGPDGEDSNIWLVRTHTSLDTTRAAANFIGTYLDSSPKFGTLSRGTSDHKSWFDRGVPTLFGFESTENYNPYIHSAADTTDKFNNLPLNLEINRLALIYLAHYAGLESASAEYDGEKSEIFSQIDNDLKVAITSNDQLAVATDTSVEELEFCMITDASSMDCSQERQTLDQYEDRGTRRFFYSESSFSFASEQQWRLWAYDSSHNLILKRDIILQ